jgi:hypothetical protein
MLGASLALGLAACGSLDSSSNGEPRASSLALRITEIHYHPLDQDTVSGDEYEFVELWNAGKAAVSLAQVGFTSGITFSFPSGAELAAGKYLVLASNPDRFRQRYGFEPFGAFTGNLKNSGETLELRDLQADTVLATVTYSDKAPWPARADGGGSSLVPRHPEAVPSGGADWKASFADNGSPGKADPVAVLINEVSPHTDPPKVDAIELYNPNDEPVAIGGWFLSDDHGHPAKFRIPSGTMISAGGYLVFDEGDFNIDSNSSTSFRISQHGDDVYLSADSSGCAGFCDSIAFGEIENGHTFGRLVDSRGRIHFVEQKAATLGAENAGPAVGPLVISEIMYHPANDSDEYVELVNVTGDSLPLFDPLIPENTWKVKGLGFTFPVGITLAGKEAVLILSASAPEDSFRTAHGIPASVRIFTSRSRLSNGGDSLSLLKPEEPYDDGTGTVVPYKLVEKVVYGDAGAWPSAPDGGGQALLRKDPGAFADDPAAWKAGAPSPGSAP